MALNNNFSAVLGWDEQRASQLIWDCFKYAQKLDKTDFKVFTCTVDMARYRMIRSTGLRLPHPYAICSRFCSEQILKWYLEDFSKNFVRGRLNYFFDRGEKHMAAFNIRRKAAAKSVRKPSLDLRTHWDLVEDTKPVDSRKCYPVQLADIISWSHNRRLMWGKYGNTESGKWASLSGIAENILPFRRAEITGKELSIMAMYSGLIPENVEDMFGPDWHRSLL